MKTKKKEIKTIEEHRGDIKPNYFSPFSIDSIQAEQVRYIRTKINLNEHLRGHLKRLFMHLLGDGVKIIDSSNAKIGKSLYKNESFK